VRALSCPTRRAADEPRTARPTLETLEDRSLPSTLGGIVFDDANNNGTREDGESGLAGVLVTVTGRTTTNRRVSVTQRTDATGAYSFGNLAAGAYSVQVGRADGYIAGLAAVGSAGGVGLDDAVTNVFLASNVAATGYTFGKLAKAQGWSEIESTINGKAVPRGGTLWFSSSFQAKGVGSEPVTLRFVNQTLTFQVNGATRTIAVPDAEVTFSPTATAATTTFDAATNTWVTTLPSGLRRDGFLSGVAVPMPDGLPRGAHSVTWQGQFLTDTPGVTVRWDWGAAVYSAFSSDYNALGVQAADDARGRWWHRPDQAGTPDAYKVFFRGGAQGGCFEGFTGSRSGSAKATPWLAELPAASLSGRVTDVETGAGIGGVRLILEGTDEDGRTVFLEAWTADDGTYTFSNLRAGQYTITQDVPLDWLGDFAYPGTIDGTEVGTAFTNSQIGEIFLGTDLAGVGYNFTNRPDDDGGLT